MGRAFPDAASLPGRIYLISFIFNKLCRPLPPDFYIRYQSFCFSLRHYVVFCAQFLAAYFHVFGTSLHLCNWLNYYFVLGTFASVQTSAKSSKYLSPSEGCGKKRQKLRSWYLFFQFLRRYNILLEKFIVKEHIRKIQRKFDKWFVNYLSNNIQD